MELYVRQQGAAAAAAATEAGEARGTRAAGGVQGERAVEAGTFFVEADGVWRRAPGATIFRMPWSRNGRTVFVQLVLRHSEHYGVANSERFLSHQRALAAGMVADRFNGMPYDQRLALVERRADLLRSAPDAPETQRFLAGHFPDDVVLQQPELILRPAL